jgi:hypothetical protein
MFALLGFDVALNDSSALAICCRDTASRITLTGIAHRNGHCASRSIGRLWVCRHRQFHPLIV